MTESRPPFKTEQAAGVMRVLGTNSKSLDRLSGLTTHVEKKIPSLKYKNYSVSVEQLNFQSLLSHSIEHCVKWPNPLTQHLFSAVFFNKKKYFFN